MKRSVLIGAFVVAVILSLSLPFLPSIMYLLEQLPSEVTEVPEITSEPIPMLAPVDDLPAMELGLSQESASQPEETEPEETEPPHQHYRGPSRARMQIMEQRKATEVECLKVRKTRVELETIKRRLESAE